jgi:diguanylate cyclase (GGDEF)-like protein/PAS domain S-box-containing protein
MSPSRSLQHIIFNACRQVPAATATNIFVALVCLTLIAVDVWSSLNARAAKIREAENTTLNLSRALAQHADDILRTTDTALLDLLERLESTDGVVPNAHDAHRLQRIMNTRRAELTFLLRMAAFDERGNLMMSSENAPPPPANIAQRDYFRFHRTHEDRNVHVGPARQTRFGDDWVITLSRRMDHPDGSFAGIVQASLKLTYFQRYYDSFNIGSKGVIVLALTDGTLLTRRPFVADMIGQAINITGYRTGVPEGHASGTRSVQSASDGVARLSGSSALEDFPMVVITSLSRDEVLAAWWQTTYVHSLGVLLLTLLLALLGFWLVRLIARRSAAETALRATLDALPAKICVLDTAGTIVAVNQAWCDFYETDLARQTIGVQYGLLCTPKAVPQRGAQAHVKREIGKIVRGGGTTFEFEYSCHCSAGPHWFRVRAARFGKLGQKVVLTHEDITELKMAEIDLKFSATVYRALGEAIMVMDADDRIVAVNPAFTRLSGYTEPAVLGQAFAALEDESSGEEISTDARHLMQQALETTGHWQGKISLRCSDGKVNICWLALDTIYDDGDVVRQRVGIFSKVTDHKLAEQTIWQQANFDALTGLPNRSMFHDRLQQEIKKARRTGQALALLFIDLDRFKDINDTMGHAVGDILLQQAAGRLLGCVRDADTVARLGGDEFTVILSDPGGSNNAARIAQHILRRLAEPFVLGDEQAFISASIGITHFPEDSDRVDVLIKNADQAMYAAKAQGRNRYKFFTTAMQRAAHTRMRMVNDLRSALTLQQFRVVYQPIVTLDGGAVQKAEALIRWQHPQRGLVNPAEFIPLAEETGMIVEIGNWVFTEVAQQVKRWRATHPGHLQVSVNLSPVQLRLDVDRPCGWLDYLQSLGLPGRCIALEITEGMLMETSAAVSNELLRFRAAGMQVSLDDFGTGYSSLSYLKKFDIDTLKIDQSFVRNMTPGSDDLALCEAIIVMAHKLGIQVVAEGVESREQRNMLVEAGCDFGQGYFFSRPLPADDFGRLLQSRLKPQVPRLALT